MQRVKVLRPVLMHLSLVLSCAGLMAFPDIVRPLAAVCGDGEVEPSEACDDSNTFGGDGCAANCTLETVREFVIDPSRSIATTQFANAAVALNLEGRLRFITGSPGDGGVIPFVVRADGVSFSPIQVADVACACVRTFELPDVLGFGPEMLQVVVLDAVKKAFLRVSFSLHKTIAWER